MEHIPKDKTDGGVHLWYAVVVEKSSHEKEKTDEREGNPDHVDPEVECELVPKQPTMNPAADKSFFGCVFHV